MLHDDGQALGRDLRADIVQHDARKPVSGTRREEQRDQAPARGAEERDAVEPKMVEQLENIARLGFDRIAFGRARVRPAAVIERDHQHIRQVRRT